MAFDANLQAVDAEMTVEVQMYQGYSAYEIAVQNGFEGSETEWLDSLHAASLTVNGKAKDEMGNISLNASDVPVSSDVGAETVAQRLIGVIPVADGAGAHNAIYRGASLGTSVSAAQWAAIGNGTFAGLYIGDYWTINSVVYRIAAFDYYYNTGDTACTTHHVVIVPDGSLGSGPMNDANTTSGAYVGSKMYTEGLTQAKTTINSAFGSAHILSHRQYLHNAITNGYTSGGSWYDSTVELMTEQAVYGSDFFSNVANGTAVPYYYSIDKSQYPLFAHKPDMIIANRLWFWLRDVASANNFCNVRENGNADNNAASYSYGIRPAFCIKQ